MDNLFSSPLMPWRAFNSDGFGGPSSSEGGVDDYASLACNLREAVLLQKCRHVLGLVYEQPSGW